MKLKLDENLPESLVGELAALGHDVDNVRLEGLTGQSDPDIWGRRNRTDASSSPKTSISRITASSLPARITA